MSNGQSGSNSKSQKVALLYGGDSAEREVSLKSGQAAFNALSEKGVEIELIDFTQANAIEILQRLESEFGYSFIALHGRGGEDGRLQGALELIGHPFTGSGMAASAIAMNKLRTKQVWQSAGIATPEYRVLTPESDFEQVVEELGLPLIVKPAHEGSSIGMSKVHTTAELEGAYQAAAKYDGLVFAEQWVTGSEYTVAILNGQALPMIKLQTPNEFYDFEAKYVSDNTEYLCPCGLPQEQEESIQALALQAFDLLGADGWGRIDVMMTNEGDAKLIELNTVPGLTDHSLVPMAARHAGIEFNELIYQILKTSGYEG